MLIMIWIIMMKLIDDHEFLLSYHTLPVKAAWHWVMTMIIVIDTIILIVIINHHRENQDYNEL